MFSWYFLMLRLKVNSVNGFKIPGEDEPEAAGKMTELSFLTACEASSRSLEERA